MTSRSRIAVCLVVVAVLAAGVVPLPVGAATYEVTSPDGIDTPDRTVSVFGDEFTLTESARISQGDTLRLDTTGPSGETYDVQLRNSDQDFERSNEATGSERVTFSTGDLDPGTYFAIILDNGNVQAIYPIIIKKYAVDVTSPGTAEAGTSFEVSTTLTEETSGPPALDTVEVAIAEAGSEDIVVQEELSADGSMQYSGTVSVPDTGEYNVYMYVRGDDTVQGYDEKVILGLSDPQTLEVEDAATPTPDDTDDGASGGAGGGGGGGGGAGSADSTDTATPTETSTPTETPTPMPTETPAETPSEQTETPDETTDEPDSETGDNAGASDDSTAVPTEEPTAASTDEPTTETSAPLTAVPLLLALLLVAGVALRLRR